MSGLTTRKVLIKLTAELIVRDERYRGFENERKELQEETRAGTREWHAKSERREKERIGAGAGLAFTSSNGHEGRFSVRARCTQDVIPVQLRNITALDEHRVIVFTRQGEISHRDGERRSRNRIGANERVRPEGS